MIDRQIGNYHVVRQIGVGGMGAVYEAIHPQIKRRAAIKVLLTEYARKPEIIARFLNEARAVNVIAHPSVVSIYELGQLEDGEPYIIMEYLEGDRLSDRLPGKGGRIDAWVLRVVRQLATALAAAHEKGVIHRDLKPDNVMLVRDPETPGGERVKLLDFGIAKMAESEVHTRSGMLMGTPRYMSPEQCRGAGEVDDRTDVYSLGVILYQFLAGKPPFSGPMGDLISQHLNEPPPPVLLANPQVSEELAQLVHGMLAKSRTERPTMGQVVSSLDAFLNGARVVPQTQADEPAIPQPTEMPIGEPAIRGPMVAETRRALGGGRARLALLVAGVCLVAAAFGLRGILRGQPMLAPTAQKPPLVAAPMPPTQTVAVPPPSLAPIHWSVASTPAGALVVRVADEQVLGQTPFQMEQLPSSGSLSVVLRRKGFVDRQLDLSMQGDETRQEKLIPLPARRTPAPVSSPATQAAPEVSSPATQAAPERKSVEPPNRAPILDYHPGGSRSK